MEAGNSAARDGNEAEREQRARNDGAAAAHVLAQRRHLEFRIDDDDAEGEQEDGADLREGAQVAARRQQQPHRHHRGREAVDAERDHDLRARQVEQAREPRVRVADRLAGPERHQQADHANDGGFRRLALAPHVHPHAHEHAERNRHGDGERAPDAVGKRVDERDAEAGQGDDQNEDDHDRRDEAHRRADLLLDDVRQRSAAAARRCPQHGAVVDRARDATSGDQPDEARGVAELGRQHRANQRSGAGDGREMVAEHHPLAGRVVVRAVVLGMSGSLARVIQHPDFGGEERAVIPVRDGKNAERGKDYIKCMHRS